MTTSWWGSRDRREARRFGWTPLEAWWARARTLPDLAQRAPRSRAEAPVLTREAARLYGRLSLSQRSWLLVHVGHLGSISAAQEHVRANVLAIDARGALVAGPATPPEVPAHRG